MLVTCRIIEIRAEFNSYDYTENFVGVILTAI